MHPEMSLIPEREQMREQQLLPLRHPQGELFLCDLGDVPLKDDAASMEHPIFALSTKPDTKERIYEHNGNTLTVTPSAVGLATIYDKDILIFAISQIMEAKNKGLPYSKEVSFNAKDFLTFANRMTNGRGYSGLNDALKRLGGTRLETNIETNDEQQIEGFGLIEKYRIRKTLNNGTVTDWGITLSDWLFNAIEANEVLTLHPEYFRLRKPLERRIYEIVRKHCGEQKEWKIGLHLLLKKTGSQTPLWKFRQLLTPIIEADLLPDYSAKYTGENNEFIIFQNRRHKEKRVISGRIVLQTETYAKAKRAAPSWDIYFLEQQWRGWMADKSKSAPDNPDAAFIGFCKSWYKNNGHA